MKCAGQARFSTTVGQYSYRTYSTYLCESMMCRGKACNPIVSLNQQRKSLYPSNLQHHAFRMRPISSIENFWLRYGSSTIISLPDSTLALHHRDSSLVSELGRLFQTVVSRKLCWPILSTYPVRREPCRTSKKQKEITHLFGGGEYSANKGDLIQFVSRLRPDPISSWNRRGVSLPRLDPNSLGSGFAR